MGERSYRKLLTADLPAPARPGDQFFVVRTITIIVLPASLPLPGLIVTVTLSVALGPALITVPLAVEARIAPGILLV
jgi:hypothetical protein